MAKAGKPALSAKAARKQATGMQAAGKGGSTCVDMACQCGGSDFASCCGRYLQYGQIAPTPEALMRSRYSAYVRGNEAYLRATWEARTCPPGPILDTDPGLKWLGLEVRRASMDEAANTGVVEFVARFKTGGRAQRLHEVSRFVRENGRWYYLDGQFPTQTPAVGKTASAGVNGAASAG